MAPALLKPGDRLGVVAPAHPFAEDGLQAGMKLVRSWGLVPVEAPSLRARHRYTAGTVAERVADLQWGLSAGDLDGVWFARGGSGTARLLDQIDWAGVADNRVVVGFSDATALFAAMWRHARGVPLHGPVLHSLTNHVDDPTRSTLRAVLAGDRPALPSRFLCGPRQPVQAPMVGGNLCVLASLCGTHWQLDARGCLLLIEDIGEPPYKIDRLLLQLHQSGALDGVAGIVLGEFTGCGPRHPDADWTMDELFTDLLSPLNVPVFTDVPVGHGATNHAFVWGREVALKPEDRGDC